jgi:hypothetical protein
LTSSTIILTPFPNFRSFSKGTQKKNQDDAFQKKERKKGIKMARKFAKIIKISDKIDDAKSQGVIQWLQPIRVVVPELLKND